MPVSVSEDRLSWGALLACLALVFSATLAVAAAPREGEPVAVVFAPWHDERTIFDRVVAAGATPIDFGNLPGIVVISSEDWVRLTFLRDAGALFAVDASLTSALCIIK